MYTYEEYSKKNAFGAYLTGTVIGFLKWSDMSEKDKKHLAKSLMWCYERSGEEMSEIIQEDLKKYLQK